MVQRIGLVSEYISDDTIVLLEELLARAKRGEVVGVSFVTLNRDRHQSVGWGGVAYHKPLLALGSLELLKHCLIEHIKP